MVMPLFSQCHYTPLCLLQHLVFTYNSSSSVPATHIPSTGIATSRQLASVFPYVTISLFRAFIVLCLQLCCDHLQLLTFLPFFSQVLLTLRLSQAKSRPTLVTATLSLRPCSDFTNTFVVVSVPAVHIPLFANFSPSLMSTPNVILMSRLLQAVQPLFNFGCVQDSPTTLDLCVPAAHIPLFTIAHPLQLFHLPPLINHVNGAASSGSVLISHTCNSGSQCPGNPCSSLADATTLPAITHQQILVRGQNEGVQVEIVWTRAEERCLLAIYILGT